MHNPHYLISSLISCDDFGKIKTIQGIITNESDHYYNYIDLYWSKSTEEFTNKLMKGDVSIKRNAAYILKKINIYFSLCEINEDKIN